MKLPKIFPAILLASISTVSAAPVFQADPNAEGVGGDIWDLAQGSQVIFSSPQHNGAGNSDPRSAFGFSSGFVEATHALWQDSAAGVTDFLEWQTPTPIDLTAISLHLADDGSPFRSVLDYRLFASQDGVNFSVVSSGVIPANVNGYVNNPLLIDDTALAGTTTAVRAFRLEMTRATAGGTRVSELDATGTVAAPVTMFLDRVAFNDSTNSLTGRGGAGKDDEGAGLGLGYTFSSAVLGGVDTVRDAFGGNHGAVEPEDFIFGDGGAVDNGNLTMGDGETVDFIDWHTAQPISLAGFRLGLSGDGASANRDTELVRFFVEGVPVDLFDNNGFDGDVTRLFAGGAALADDFRIEFTRTTGSGGRVFEIDAITSVSNGWIGPAGDNHWSNVVNWSGPGPAAGERNLFFGREYKAAGGNSAVTAQNNLVAYIGNRLAFQDSDVTGATVDGVDTGDTAFTITGNGFTLSEIGGSFPRIENGSFVTQTFDLTAGQTITLNDATNHKAEINPTNGDLIFSATTPINLTGVTQLQISGNNGHTVTFNAAISSSGNGGANGVTIAQNSNVVFAASNTYTGATNVNAGVLTLGHFTDSIADTAPVLVNGGTLAVPNTETVGVVTLSSGTISGAGTLTGSAYLLTNTGTISANLGNTAANLTKTGAGTATISGNAPYTGLTRVLNGTLKFEIPGFYNGFASDIVNESTVEFNVSGFFNRNIAGGGRIVRTGGEFILGGGTTADSQSWVLNGGRTFYNTQANLGGGPITVNNGAKLIKNTGGDLTLTNAVTLNNGGGLNNRGGTLAINSVTLPASGTVVFNLDDQPTTALNLDGPAATLDGTGFTVEVGGANASVGTVTLSQAIGGVGALTKTGPGALTLSGVQGYDTLNATVGTTNLNNTLGTGASVINAGAEVNISVSQTLGALNIADGAVVTLGDLPPPAPAFAEGLGGDFVESNAQAVPEPGSLALLLLGGVLFLRRTVRPAAAIRLLAVSLATLSAATAAPVFQADPNAEGVGSDIWDLSQGSQVIFSSPQHNGAGNSDPRSAFGFSSGFAETTHALWQDGAAGVIDFLEWQTPQPIDLSGISLHLFDDASPNRSALDFKLFASQDGVNFSQISGGTMPADAGGYLNNPLLITDSAFTGTTSAVRAFRLEMTRTTGAGTRVAELDATGTVVAPVTTFLDRVAFNDATNSLTGRGAAANDDEGAGLASGFTFSSAVAGGADTVRDAFGGNHGTIEPEDFIFGDGGVPDNGNLTLGDGGETVDFIQWQTSAPLTLAGFRIGLAGDGGGNPDRDTQLIRFLVEGQEVALFDNDGFDGNVTHLFSGGAVTGDDFRIEFTRTTGQGGRIFEIDAITTAVPEPGSLALVLLGGAVLARRRGK